MVPNSQKSTFGHTVLNDSIAFLILQVHEFFATYGVTYGDSSDGAVKIPEEQAREQLVHIGTALVLPVRALATNSGGYTHHKPDDVFALHHFAGEWKIDKDAGLDLGAEPVRG